MEMREWAWRVFHADCLEEKLVTPPGGLKALTDDKPGSPILWTPPPRPNGLQVSHKKTRFKFPKPGSLHSEEMRIRCLHTFANHELMALEMMAWALLAFPEADKHFRLGLAKILLDEQRHFQLYSDLIASKGARFGDLPLNDHFWRLAGSISNPLDWVCTMHLTFEQANLDHAPFFGRLFQEFGDQDSAELMEVIFRDEVGHVGFGSRWLKKMKPEDVSLFQAFEAHCPPGSPPERAKGPEFQTQARLQAGLDQEFIDQLKSW